MTREEEILSQAKLITGLFSFRNGLQTPEDAYVLGAKWADANPINPWHKASEELPKEDGKYLVLCGEKLYTTVIDYTASPRYWHIIGYQSDVKYWMEIPELPKED